MSPTHGVGHRVLGGHPQKSTATYENTLDTVVLESGLHSLNLTDGQQSSNRKVEEWLRQSSAAATMDTLSPGRLDTAKDGVGSPTFTDSLAFVRRRKDSSYA